MSTVYFIFQYIYSFFSKVAPKIWRKFEDMQIYKDSHVKRFLKEFIEIIAWSTGCLKDCLTDRQTHWTTDELTDWMTNKQIDKRIIWRMNWLHDGLLNGIRQLEVWGFIITHSNLKYITNYFTKKIQ